MVEQLPAFLAVSVVLIVAPGPDMALVARNVLRDGRRSGLATGLGVSVGLAVWTIAASVGLAALLRASEPAFVTLKVVGSTYLVYLGARSLIEAVRGRSHEHAARHPERYAPLATVSLRQGLVSNLGNPKIAVFFTGLLPQFAPAHDRPFLTLLALGLLFSVLTLAWLTCYSILVARAGELLRRGGIRRALEGVTGVVLVGLGVRLAFERRP
jgi:threonine/homoserine/homoserine lactone efflux protein